MIITDEMVRRAQDVFYSVRRTNCSITANWHETLEAIAPLLIADVQRELDACNGALANSGKAYALALADRNKRIAQELREMAERMECKDDHDHLIEHAQELDPK